MKKTFLLKNIPLLLLACGLMLTVAFAQTTVGKGKTPATDTLPTKQKKIRDLDEALSEIDRGEIEMQRALSDTEKWQADFRKSMDAMKIDMAKMKEDLAKEMKEIDVQKINLEVQKALQEVDAEKIKKEVQESLAKVDMEKEMTKARAELEKIKDIDFKKMREEMEKARPEMEKAMKDAKVSVEKARAEVRSYRDLVNDLDRDGLLKKSESYTVEYKNKELTVNGKKLSAEATKKYGHYLDGKKDFTLKKDEDGLDIDSN